MVVGRRGKGVGSAAVVAERVEGVQLSRGGIAPHNGHGMHKEVQRDIAVLGAQDSQPGLIGITTHPASNRVPPLGNEVVANNPIPVGDGRITIPSGSTRSKTNAPLDSRKGRLICNF